MKPLVRDIEADMRAEYLRKYALLKAADNPESGVVAHILRTEFGVEVNPEPEPAPEVKAPKRTGRAPKETADHKAPETADKV